MRPPRLVIADLDGTLLNGKQIVSVATAAALDRLGAEGIGFTAATGRSAGKLRITGATKWANLPWMCCTGAVTIGITDTAIERLTASLLQPPVIAAAMTVAREHCNDPAFGGDRSEVMITGPGYPPSPAWVNCRDLEPGEDFADAPVDMLRVSATDAQYLVNVPVPGLVWHDVGRAGYIEATAAGTSKSAAAAKLAADLGIDAADIWCFGDGLNDVDLLEWAGRGVAMREAAPEVLAAADDVTDLGHEDDGFADYLATRLGW